MTWDVFKAYAVLSSMASAVKGRHSRNPCAPPQTSLNSCPVSTNRLFHSGAHLCNLPTFFWSDNLLYWTSMWSQNHLGSFWVLTPSCYTTNISLSIMKQGWRLEGGNEQLCQRAHTWFGVQGLPEAPSRAKMCHLVENRTSVLIVPRHPVQKQWKQC